MLSNGRIIKVTMRASPDNGPDHPDVMADGFRAKLLQRETPPFSFVP